MERTESVIIFGKRPLDDSSSPLSSPTTAKNARSEDDHRYVLPITPQTSPLCDENSRKYVRRGRPKLEAITSLIISGTISPSPIRCHVCNRVFPREKSLQAHLRTHTGERPYLCDFPGCGRKFTQSGQLRTHQRLHTGEKPFACAFPGCKNRFTHANRHCPQHPDYGIKRDKSERNALRVNTSIENTNEDIVKWLDRHSKLTRRGKDNGSSRFLQRSSTARLRARKLNRELEAVQGDESESFDCFAAVWKKKRATLKSNVTSVVTEPITNEKLMGALALMELAGSSPVESLPIVDIGSEIDIHDECSDGFTTEANFSVL